jgi:hypothetical protein
MILIIYNTELEVQLELNFLNVILYCSPSYSLKYIYLRVYLLMLDVVVLHSFVMGWVFFVMCK